MPLMQFQNRHYTNRGPGVAAHAVQYLMREGRHAWKDGELRNDVRHIEAAGLPAWAEGSAEWFFREAVRRERANGRWARGWQMTVPGELPREEQLAMVRAFLDTYLEGKPRLWVLHDTVEGSTNPHVHVLFSTRTDDGRAREPGQEFARWNRQHPERGGWQKDPWFLERRHLREVREAWADWVNLTLERAGVEGRIHPSSLYKQGLERKPEPRCYDPEERARMRERVHGQRDIAGEQAWWVEAWEQRKVKLGITDVQSLDTQQFLRESRDRARGGTPGVWYDRQGVHAQEVLKQQAQALAVQRALLAQEMRLLQRRLAGLMAPGRPERSGQGSGVRVRLYEETYGHEQGVGFRG